MKPYAKFGANLSIGASGQMVEKKMFIMPLPT